MRLYSDDLDSKVNNIQNKSLSYFRLRLYAKSDKNDKEDDSEKDSDKQTNKKNKGSDKQTNKKNKGDEHLAEAKKSEVRQTKDKQTEAKQTEAKQTEAKQTRDKQSETKQIKDKQAEDKQPQDKQVGARQSEDKKEEAKPEKKEEGRKEEVKRPESIKDKFGDLVGGPKKLKYDCMSAESIPSKDFPVLKYGFSNPDDNCEFNETITCPVEAYFGLVLHANLILALNEITETMLTVFRGYFLEQLNSYLTRYINRKKSNQETGKQESKEANQESSTQNAQNAQSKKRLSLYASNSYIRKLKLYADEESDEEDKKKKENASENRSSASDKDNEKDKGSVRDSDRDRDSAGDKDSVKGKQVEEGKQTKEDKQVEEGKRTEADKQTEGAGKEARANQEIVQEGGEQGGKQGGKQEDEQQEKDQNKEDSKGKDQLDPEIRKFLDGLNDYINNSIVKQFFTNRMLNTFGASKDIMNVTFNSVKSFFVYVKERNYKIEVPELKNQDAINRVGVRIAPIINKITKTLSEAFSNSITKLRNEVAKVKEANKSNPTLPEEVFQLVKGKSNYDKETINKFITSFISYVKEINKSDQLINHILSIPLNNTNKKKDKDSDNLEVYALRALLLSKQTSISQVFDNIFSNRRRDFYYEKNASWIVKVVDILDIEDNKVPDIIDGDLKEIADLSNNLEKSLGITDCKERRIIKSDLISCISFVSIVISKIGNAKLEKYLEKSANQSEEEFKKKLAANLANNLQYGDVQLNWLQKSLLFLDDFLREIHVLPTEPPIYRLAGTALESGFTCTAIKKAYELKYRQAQKSGNAEKMRKVIEHLKRDIIFRQKARLEYKCLEKLLNKLRI